MTRRARMIVAAVVLLGTAGFVTAGIELVLRDGSAIRAESVRRLGDSYEVRDETGERTSVPASEIVQIRASAEPRPGSGSADEGGAAVANRVQPAPDSAREARRGDEEQRGGSARRRRAPPPRVQIDPHLRPSRDESLALSGPDIPPPTKEEQLEVFGAPSEWSKPAFDPYWRPSDAFGR